MGCADGQLVNLLGCLEASLPKGPLVWPLASIWRLPATISPNGFRVPCRLCEWAHCRPLAAT
eukprot:14763436-Alexandrium_andersonii.AAC.1